MQFKHSKSRRAGPISPHRNFETDRMPSRDHNRSLHDSFTGSGSAPAPWLRCRCLWILYTIYHDMLYYYTIATHAIILIALDISMFRPPLALSQSWHKDTTQRITKLCLRHTPVPLNLRMSVNIDIEGEGHNVGWVFISDTGIRAQTRCPQK